MLLTNLLTAYLLIDQFTQAAFLFAMKLTTATISYHMQALIDAGLFSVEKLNNRLYFQVHEEHLQEYLKQIEQKILQP